MEILKVVLCSLKEIIITIALRSKKYRASKIFIIINNNKNVTTVLKYFNKLFNKKTHIMFLHLLYKLKKPISICIKMIQTQSY